MKLWKQMGTLIRTLTGHKATPAPRASTVSPPIQEEEEETPVPEITVEELRTALRQEDPPLVIDIREAYEWRLVRMPPARHIPMNEVPSQLDSLPRDKPVVVMCAHGSRSYSVAAWLIEQGVNASSLAGGITRWANQGGVVEQGDVTAQ